MDKARAAAYRILCQVHQQGAYANVALAQELRRGDFSDIDRRFITELVYGTVKAKGTLEWAIKKYLARPWNKTKPEVQEILRLGAYQIMYMDKVPDSAACNEAVELAKKFANEGAGKFVNGVLRSMVRNSEKRQFPEGKGNATLHLALRSQHPEWLVRRWIKEFGYEEAAALCRFNNTQPPVTLRTNTLRTSPSELFLQLTAAGAEAHRCKLTEEGFVLDSHGALDYLQPLQEGYCQVQDESSMLVAHVVNPQPYEVVLDVCSAPGGKTTHLAALMQNEGRIIACDIYDHKLHRVEENAKRLGIYIIETKLLDAREAGKTFPQLADRVLVDAPCSGLGVLRRKPDSRWRKEAAMLQELPQLQLEILRSAAQALKPGGTLVYSTCSIAREENQDVVEKFLQEAKDFQLVNAGERLPVPRDEAMVQLYPQRDGTDGFFIACLQKQA